MDLNPIAAHIAAAIGIPLIRFAQGWISAVLQDKLRELRNRRLGVRSEERQEESFDLHATLDRALGTTDGTLTGALDHRAKELAQRVRRDSAELSGLLVEIEAITVRRAAVVSEQVA
jgi:hypothetical protein